MAAYVLLAKFTQQGIRDVKDTVKRAEYFKEMAKSAGVTVKELYWTLGRCDIVVTCEAADEMAITTLGLSLGKAGNVQTETLRAFSATEMTKILAKVT